MRKKMEEVGREFTWNYSENALLMTDEQRDATARAAMVGGGSQICWLGHVQDLHQRN